MELSKQRVPPFVSLPNFCCSWLFFCSFGQIHGNLNAFSSLAEIVCFGLSSITSIVFRDRGFRSGAEQSQPGVTESTISGHEAPVIKSVARRM